MLCPFMEMQQSANDTLGYNNATVKPLTRNVPPKYPTRPNYGKTYSPRNYSNINNPNFDPKRRNNETGRPPTPVYKPVYNPKNYNNSTKYNPRAYPIVRNNSTVNRPKPVHYPSKNNSVSYPAGKIPPAIKRQAPVYPNRNGSINYARYNDTQRNSSRVYPTRPNHPIKRNPTPVYTNISNATIIPPGKPDPSANLQTANDQSGKQTDSSNNLGYNSSNLNP